MHPYIHPSVPKSPKSGSQPRPLAPSARNNLPPRPDYANLNSRRPSETWLKSLNPGWIDGASEPPIFFHSPDDIVMTMLTWNPAHPMFSAVPETARPPPFETTGPPPFDTAGPPPSYPGFAGSAPGAVLPAAPTAAAGYQVSIVLQYTAPDLMKPGVHAKTAVKQVKSTKLAIIDIIDMDRCGFIKSILDVHDYGDEYSPGVNRGPPFKISWTGASGGRGGAPTIETDAEFKVVLESLKKKTAPAVVVELNLDQMDGYRVMKKRALPQDGDENVELMYGTKVPRVEDYTPQDQLQGAMIMKLNTKWACEKHHGENGDVGHCWIDPNGNHIGLNMQKKKLWASAIVAGDATAHEPPNSVEFDGVRDGRLSCPRGRGGPRLSLGGGPSNSDGDATMMVLAAVLPLLQNLALRGDPLKTPPRSDLPAAFPPAPRKINPLSPIPSTSSELHVCLDDFLKLKSINLLEAESALAALSLTPEIIGQVPVERLREITGAVEGHLWAFQAFCRQWSARLEEKKRRLALGSS
ncbi:hypothetical protein C8R45DRAFT_831641 [Mycena sanguinolenta]|nr:hypothetical protein C8R45DRAFT_831641 [Mycena sanguinolenta]